MSIDSVLTAVRNTYIRALVDAMAAHQPCHVEPALRRADGSLAVEGPLKTPYRVDLIERTTGARIMVDSSTRSPDTLVAFQTDGLQLDLNPFIWDAVSVTAQPVRAEVLPVLSEWFCRWFDPEDTHGADEHGLYRVLHYLSDPELTRDTVSFVVDFGSAGIDSFKDLLHSLAQSGATTVSIS